MLAIVITVVVVFLLLSASELLFRNNKMTNEQGRKLVHILVGVYVAFWPTYLSFSQILLIGIAFLVVVSLSYKHTVFTSIHHVDRKTYGEICFALAIISLALIAKSDWVFTTAMLVMALADGLAALVGRNFGKTNTYMVFKQPKSLIGTLTFILTSYVTLVVCKHFGNLNDNHLRLLAISFVAAGLENLAVYGLDDLVVPLAIALILNH